MLRLVGVPGARSEVAEDGVGDERGHRGDELVECEQAGVERHVCPGLVVVVLGLPEASAAAPDVPVGEEVHKLLDAASRAGGVERVEVVRDLRDEAVQLGDDPAVELVRRWSGERRLAHLAVLPVFGVGVGVEAVDVGVGDVEAVGVPEGEEELAERLLDEVRREAACVACGRGGEEVPAQSVRAVLVHHGPGVDDIALRLGHLLALAVQDEAEDEAALVGGLARDEGGEGEQAVEPAARLVDRLGDVVGREERAGDEVVHAVERDLLAVWSGHGDGVLPLRERHRAGVVPGVGDLGHALHRSAAAGLAAAQFDAVDVRAVQVEAVKQAARLVGDALGEVGGRARDGDVPGVFSAAPDGDGRAPVALARDGPVDVVAQPLPEAALLDVLRHPLDAAVAREHLVLHGGRADVPGGLGVVEQGRATAPAEGVGVPVGRGVVEEQAALVEVADQLLVGVLHERAAAGEVVGKHAVDVDRVDGLDAVRPAELGVLGAVGDRAVHDAGAVGGRDVVGGEDTVGMASLGEKRAVGGVVLDADEVGAGAARDLVPAVAEDGRREGFGDDGAFAVVVLRQHVSHVGADGERAVRGERPGGGCPGDEGGSGRGPASVVVAESRQSRGRRAVRHGLRFLRGEADIDAGVGRVLLIAEGDLVGAEARDATGAVRRHLVAFVDEALVPEALEHPPCRLDVRVVVGDVGVIHVQPDAGAVGHGLPFADVAEDALAAAAVELLDA